MGIFSGLFRSRDKPTDSMVGSRYAFYMGGSTSGKMVTERSAMQMTAVYACVRALATHDTAADPAPILSIGFRCL